MVIVRMPDDTDFDALADQLERSGFDRPDDDATAGGVWDGGAALLAEIGSDADPRAPVRRAGRRRAAGAHQRHRRLPRAGRRRARRRRPARGDAGRGRRRPGDAARRRRSTTAPYTCSALAMGHADPADRAEGERLVAEAGEVNPLTGFAMSVQPGGDVRVAMAFEGDGPGADQRRHPRACWPAGRRPGQGGDFADRFTRRRPRPPTATWSPSTSRPPRAATCSPTSRPGRCCSRPAECPGVRRGTRPSGPHRGGRSRRRPR